MSADPFTDFITGNLDPASAATSGAATDAGTWLDRLNPQQRAAATHGSRGTSGRFEAGPLLVIAGAGTGKTATLAHRVAWLVLQGVDPQRILLLTFSRRAAQEMTRRAESIAARVLAQARNGTVGTVHSGSGANALRLPWAGTFHSIGARMLRAEAATVGLDPAFGVLDRGDAADLIDVVRHELGLSNRERRFPRKDTCLAIYSHRVNTGWPLERVLAQVYPWCAEWADDLRALFRAYVARKQAHAVLDYDDLLLWWHSALRDADGTPSALARAIGERFDHVLVDEYQDTNVLQAQILLALKPDGAGVTVVGDDAQSIYGFRAADVGNILEFPERFEPPARRVTLDCNYRSVQPVLDAANALIRQSERQYPKTLHAQRGPGAAPRLVTVLDERAQADYVIGEILAQRETGVPLKQQAVLFRSGHHSDLLEVELVRRDIPFVKHGGLKFLEAAHIKDLLAVLRWADNLRNGIAAFRALQLIAGIGPATARRGFEHVQQAGSIEALATFASPPAAAGDWPGFVALMGALVAPGCPWAGQVEQVRRWYQPVLEQRFDDAAVRAADLEMLATISAQFPSRERFLTDLTLDPPSATGDLAGEPLRDEDYLILSTVHSAKGQEWDSVFVLNVADGNFPNEYATGSQAGIEEERRLLYVAMTRARNRLHLVEPQRYHVTQQPRLGGDHVYGARSRFLTGAVLAACECIGWCGDATAAHPEGTRAGTGVAPIDVAGRMRDMW